MDLALTGRLAVVTGGSKGIGLAVTRALVAEGVQVVTGSRSISPALEALAADGRVHPLAVDLASPDGPAALVEHAEAIGGVDLLVNNAGAVSPRAGGFLSVDDADWEATLQLGLLATVRAIRAVLPGMLMRDGRRRRDDRLRQRRPAGPGRHRLLGGEGRAAQPLEGPVQRVRRAGRPLQHDQPDRRTPPTEGIRHDPAHRLHPPPVDPLVRVGASLPFAQLRSGFPVLGNPANRSRTVALTSAQFRYAFGSALSEEESDRLFEAFTIPGPGRPLFEDATANFKKHSPAAVDTHVADRGPLLITSGTVDHTVPRAVTAAVVKLYEGSPSVTDYREFEGRGHSLSIDAGWRDVAGVALEWLRERASLSSTSQTAVVETV